MRALLTIVALTLATGCSKPEFIKLDPTSLDMTRKGQESQIKGRAEDRRGHYFADVTFEWTTDNPEIATVDERGFVKAVSSGSTFVHANAGDLTSKALVNVVLVEKIDILDNDLEISLEAGERFEPRIKVYDYKNREMNGRQIFLQARPGEGDVKVVTIDGQGGIWPANVGETVIDCEVEGVKGTINVKVVK